MIEPAFAIYFWGFLLLYGTVMYVISPPATVYVLMADASYHRRIVSAPDYSIRGAVRL